MAVWYDDALKLRDFAAALEASEYADESEVLKKPYRFENAYSVWKANDFPSAKDPNWDDFITGLDELSEE